MGHLPERDLDLSLDTQEYSPSSRNLICHTLFTDAAGVFFLLLFNFTQKIEVTPRAPNSCTAFILQLYGTNYQVSPLRYTVMF